MVHAFTIEPKTYSAFENEAEQIEKCKEWGLLSEKATKTKAFFYKGNGMNLACEIIGFVDKMTAVIKLENKQQHCIHPSYLKEMQASNYGQKPLALAVETIESEAVDLETQAETQQKVEAEAEIIEAERGEFNEEANEAANVEKPKVEAAPKGNSKKEKAPKLQLPEDKVKMTATVKEFTTVPNNFSDSEDEVVIYEAVSIEEPATEIGAAWSSHSTTLKKLELEIGDTITFEGKIVAKKLTKHPVPYKINNPSKIQKG